MSSSVAPTVALIGSLDTKNDEITFARDLLRERGISVLLIDVGIMNNPTTKPDVSAREVASAAGDDIREMRARSEEPGARAKAIAAMAEGARTVVSDYYTEGRIDGVLGIGGGQGSTMASAALRALPIGVPKVLLTTMSPDNLGAYFGESDLCVIYSVSDISGLNRVTRAVIWNAVGAIAGMVSVHAPRADSEAPLVGITMFGTTTRGAHELQARLAAKGFETVAFHAVGSGGRAMERMIREGIIVGVIDLTPSEVVDDLFGGVFTAGPTRLRAASETDIPAVIAAGALGQITFGAIESVPKKFTVGSRTVLPHSPSVTIVRANAQDALQIGSEIGHRLEGSRHTAVLLPTLGLSDYEQPGGPLDDPEADRALTDAIASSAPDDIPVETIATDINSPEFADRAVELFLTMWQRKNGELTYTDASQIAGVQNGDNQ